MIKADLVTRVSEELNLPKKKAKEGVDTFFRTIKEALLKGDRVEIRGFGSWQWRKRKGRIGRNPKTGTAVKVPAKKILYFKPSKLLKELLNKKII